MINPNDPGSRGDGPALRHQRPGTSRSARRSPPTRTARSISPTYAKGTYNISIVTPARLAASRRTSAAWEARPGPIRSRTSPSFCEEGIAYDFGLVLSGAASAASSTRTATTAAPGRPTRAAIPGVTITLVGTDITGLGEPDDADGLDGTTSSTTSLPGTYSVVETQPAGYFQAEYARHRRATRRQRWATTPSRASCSARERRDQLQLRRAEAQHALGLRLLRHLPQRRST